MKKASITQVKIAVLVFLLSMFIFLPGNPASSADVIGVRAYGNPDNYSALRWYQEKGFAGSPQSTVVDGYEAVRDGRTVYVNAANISGGSLYTNIYLISYNQAPEASTVDIFGKMLKNWEFNADLPTGDFCQGSDLSGISCPTEQCPTDYTCDGTAGVCKIACTHDDDCNLGEFCMSEKAKVTRDTRRLAGIAEVAVLAEDYKTRTGEYPQLGAGSYIKGGTVSTWPSWQDRFALDLGTNPPLDPINIMGACTGYNPGTCWDESSKRFAGTVPDGLPSGSYALSYYSGAPDSYMACAVMETSYGGVINCKTP